MGKTQKKNSKNIKSHSKKNSKKHSKKHSKSLEETELLDKLKNLKSDYDKLIFKIDNKDELYNILDEIEKIQRELATKYPIKIGYPSIYDPLFMNKIAKKKEFAMYAIPDKSHEVNDLINDKIKMEKTDKNPIFKISNTQNFIRNYISPYTNYKNLLVIHGTGVGKTCTAISIAEQLKTTIYGNDKKITVINGKDFNRQLFDIEKVRDKQIENQCTGSEYIRELKDIGPELVEKCQNNRSECERLKTKIKQQENKYYEFHNLEAWANKIKAFITKKGKNVSDESALRYKIKHIRELYSNAVIIIDEAHTLNSTDHDSRLITRVLDDVLFYSENLRLVMLTATPMYDKASHIISLINYMLINDGRRPIKDTDLFDKDDHLLPNSEKKLTNKIQGYITYLRGNNPFDFPIRLPASINLTKDNFVSLGKKYPKIPAEFKGEHKMQILELVDCPMTHYQKEIYLEADPVKFGIDFSKLEQLSNAVFTSMKDANGTLANTYGEHGFNSIMTKIKGRPSYRFKSDETAKEFIGDNLAKYSSKIAKMLDIISKSTGPVFIYTYYLHGGIVPLLLALEMAGYLPYNSHGTPFIDSKYKSAKYKGDYIIKSGTNERFGVSAKDATKYINKGPAMVEDKNVKIFIGTASASEGINLFGYREVHILDPHFNLSRNEQVIGRTIRTGSHAHLPFMDRNVVVYQYVATLPNVESIDLYKYRISEAKAITSGKVEKILKETAIDCILNKSGNIYNETIFPDKVKMRTSYGKEVMVSLADQPYSRICHYMADCSYKCAVSDAKDNTKDNIDKSSFQLAHMEKNIYRISLEIEKLIGKYHRIYIPDLKEKLNLENDDIIKIAIFTIIDNHNIIKDKHGNDGYIDKIDDTLLFIPNWEKSNQIEYATQYVKMPDKYRYINLNYYINHITKNTSKIIAKTVLTYEDISNIIRERFDAFKYQTTGDKFNLSMTDQEIADYVYYNLIFRIKLELLKYLVIKLITSKDDKMDNLEKMLINSITPNLVYYGDFEKHGDKKKLFGFIIADNLNIRLYSYDETANELILDTGSAKKLIEQKQNLINQSKISKLYSYSKIEKIASPPVFKIVDNTIEVKKSIKGIKCTSNVKDNIISYLKLLGVKKPTIDSRTIICNDLQLTFMRLDKERKDGKRWYLYPEEFLLKLD